MKLYKIITTKSYDELLQYSQNWQALYDSLELPISYSPEWLFAWLNSYNDRNLEIDVSFVYLDDKFLAVIPFMIRIEGKKRTLKFLSDSCSDYLGIPHDNEIRDDLSEIISQQFQRLNFTHFTFSSLHEDDNSLLILISSLSSRGLKMEVGAIDKSLSISINESYSATFASTIAHRRFKRQLKDINELGEIALKVIQKPDDKLLNDIFQIHEAKWSANRVFPQFTDERRKKFIRIIANVFAERNQFVVFGLYAGEKLIAYRIGFIHNSTYYDWNTSFDITLEKYAPGTVLLIRAIQYMQSNNILRFEFMNGNENYKYMWATGTMNVFKIEGENIKNFDKIIVPTATPKLKSIKDKKCLILDMHGIIYKGGSPIISTVTGIQKLQAIGIKIGILTNVSAISVSDINKMFMSCGLHIDENYIMTSAIAIKNYLIENKIKSCILIGGEPELPSLLHTNNITIVKNSHMAEAVLVGFSKHFTYDQLVTAHEAISQGAAFICSDADMLYASDGKNLPGTGWITAAISSVCNKAPLIIGKPNVYSLQLLIDRMKVKPSDTVFVGDSMESDINIGKKLSVTTCLHLGGVNQLHEVQMLQTFQRPDFIINSFDEITEVFTKTEMQ